jgi:uncharacterized protein YndB with AHSA1/START domain
VERFGRERRSLAGRKSTAMQWVAVVFVAIAGVAIVAATKPSTFLIERSVTIDAPPQRVFGLIDDFHHWPRWAPQDRDDKTMQRTFKRAKAGNGAVSEWTSQGSAGAGTMTMSEVVPLQQVKVVVNWDRPFEAQNINTFTLTPVPQGATTATKVTWTVRGSNLYVMKAMEVFLGIDGVIGKHLDEGLRNLKDAAED